MLWGRSATASGRAGILATALLAVASVAHARTETLRWLNTDPGRVDGFYVHYGHSSRSYTAKIDVGLPAPDGNGVHSYALEVPGNATVYVALTSYDGALESPYSNEQARAPKPPEPPPPPPPNRAPESRIDAPAAQQTPIAVGEALVFAGSGTDPDGDLPLAYHWDFGNSGVAPVALEDPGAITFDRPGTFQVRLTATDSRGLADPSPAMVVVKVEAADPPPPPPPGPPPLPLTFTDVTAAAGVDYLQYQVPSPPLESDAEYMTGGVAAGDYDGDGWVDLYVTSLDAGGALFRNRGDGSFEDATTEAGLDLDLASNGAAWGDLDNDGDLDLYVTTLGPDATRFYLFVNEGNGEFSEEALRRGAALEGPYAHYGFGATFGDYDLDGWLDIHTTEWHPGAPPGSSSGSRLLRNRGEAAPGYFEDVTRSARVDLGDGPGDPGRSALSSRFADMDADGWPDLLVVADGGASRLFWNEGDGTFSDGTEAAGVGSEDSGSGSAVGDFDGDTLLDWFVASVYDPDDPAASGNRLYRNEGERVFSDATDAAGVRDGFWGMGTLFLDLDNDADLDLAMTNGLHAPFLLPEEAAPLARFARDPMRAWRNLGSGAMAEASVALGLRDEGAGRGMASLDFDRDGDLDLFVVHNGDTPVLYRNDGGNRNAWLRVEARGTDSNRDGVGTVVFVWADSEGLAQVREIESGGGFLGQSERAAHFGLGPGSAPVERVLVFWPATGRTQEFADVARNATLVAVEPLAAEPPPPDDAPGGGGGGSCGLLGIEVLPVLALAARRRGRRRRVP